MSRILGREFLELAARDPSGILRRPLSKRTSRASVKAGTSSKPMARFPPITEAGFEMANSG